MVAELEKFKVVVEWHLIEVEMYVVIARNKDDAKEVARRLFKDGHTDECIVDNIRIEGT